VIRPQLMKKRTVLLTVLLVGGALCWFFISRWANAPATQSITMQKSQLAAAVVPTYTTAQTSFFNFVLPGSFHIQTSKDAGNPNTVHVLAFETRTSSRQVGVTSTLLPADGLSGVADYNFRRATPAQYEPFTDASLPAGSKAFRKIDSSAELSVFMVHGSRYASVTLTGASSSDLQGLLGTIYAQWLWL
jgi:hypothetical protein